MRMRSGELCEAVLTWLASSTDGRGVPRSPAALVINIAANAHLRIVRIIGPPLNSVSSGLYHVDLLLNLGANASAAVTPGEFLYHGFSQSPG